MRRWLWILVVVIPALLLIGDFVYWRYTVRQLQAGLQIWLTQRQAGGWKTDVDQIAPGGWPYAATLTVSHLTLRGGDPDIPGGLSWSSDRVALRIDLWRPTVLEAAFGGEQRLRLAALPEIPCTADRLQAVMPLRFGEPPRAVDLQARNLRAVVPAAGGTTSTLTIGLLQAHGELAPPATQDKPAAQFSLSAEAVGLPQARKWPLGPTLSSFTVDGTLNGTLPLGHGLTAAATEWRDGGGALEIQHLTLGWGPLGLAASATLALDDQLQPMGAGTSHIIGYAATLDALAGDGVLSHSAATAAKAVLSLLATTPADSDQSEVDVPLTLQYRTLSMRQVPLVRLQELDWPTP
jgi:hypothetical protein